MDIGKIYYLLVPQRGKDVILILSLPLEIIRTFE